MADTIISNTPGSHDDSGMAGWLVALVIIAAVVIGGLFLYQSGFFNSTSDRVNTTNINVTTPDPVTPSILPAE